MRPITFSSVSPLRVPLLLAALVAAGCAPAAPQRKGADLKGPSAIEQKLAAHEEMQRELAASCDRYLAAVGDYESKKAAHLLAVAAELAKMKGKAALGATIATMATERGRVAQELTDALKELVEALKARAKAEHDLLAVEGKLLDVELRAFEGMKAASARAPIEINQLHDALTGLHVAQKAQQSTLAALVAREFEANAQVQEDPAARELAERQLTELRGDLEQRYAKLIALGTAYDSAADSIHKRLAGEMGPKRAAEGARMQQLLEERVQVASTIQQARAKLKEAVLKRAENRLREISFDGEITAILSGAFKDPAARDSFLIRARDSRDTASAAFVQARNAENSLSEVRRRIVTLEADVAGMGY